MATTTATAPKPTALKMPDLSEFDGQMVVDEGPSIGTVLGIDLEQWATAIVDLDKREDRIAAEKFRLHQKGFRPCEGPVTVVGFRLAEVWVMPRAKYKQRQRMQREGLYKRVRDGRLADSAVRIPNVDLTGKDGVATPIDRGE